MSVVNFTPSNQSANVFPNTPLTVLYTDPSNVPNTADTYTLTSSPATSTYTFNSNSPQIPTDLLNAPRYGVCDLSGNIYITNSNSNTVTVTNPSGVTSILIPDVSGLNSPSGITIDLSAGNATYGCLFISNAGTSGPNANCISKYYLQGPSANTLVIQDISNISYLNGPRALAFDNTYSYLYVVNGSTTGVYPNSILRFSHPTSGPDSSAVFFYDLSLNSPKDITFDACNNLYCVIGNGTNALATIANSVVLVSGNASGGTEVITPLIVGLNQPSGIRFDLSNNLYISNSGVNGTLATRFPSPNTVQKAAFSSLNPPTVTSVSNLVNVGINSPLGLFFDTSFKNLYIINNGSSVTSYDAGNNIVPTGSAGTSSFGVNSNSLTKIYMPTPGVAQTRTQVINTGLYPVSALNAQDLSGLSAKYSSPGFLTTDLSGNVYATSTNRIVKLDTTGNTSMFYQSFLNLTTTGPTAHGFSGIAADPSNNIYVLDVSNGGTGGPSSNSYLRKIDVNGNALTASNGFSNIVGNVFMNTPTGLAIDQYFNIYVANSGNGTVIKHTLDATGYNVVSATPLYQGSPTSNLQGLAVDKFNNLFVADQSNNRIIIVDTGYNTFSTYVSTIPSPYGLSLDNSRNLYVASNDASGGHIYKVVPSGSVYSPSAASITKLNTVSPTYGVAVNPLTGSLYYTDNSNCTVNRFINNFFEFDNVQFSIPGTYGLTITDTNGSVVVTNRLRVLVACYNKNTTILCLDDFGNEAYKSIQDILVGDKVLTYGHGIKAVKMIGHNSMTNNPEDELLSMYKMTKEKNSLLNDDLIVLGGHSLLVDHLSTEQVVKTAKYWGNKIEKIDDKELLLATVCEDFEQCMDNDEYTYYHLVLEPEEEGEDRKYGIYVNGGVLSETTTENFFLSHF